VPLKRPVDVGKPFDADQGRACAEADIGYRRPLDNRTDMGQPHAHLAYAPRGAGLLYAVMWIAVDDDIYGWFIGSKDGETLASYFMLQDYYGMRTTGFYRSAQDDVAGDWVEVRGDRELPLAHVPVPEPVRHELMRLQDQFVRHWLFFDDDPAATPEIAALQARQLPVRHVNIRASRVDKLRTAPAVWRHDASEADINVLIYLSKRWPLDFDAAA
jgi:hypothetical protein